MSCLSSCPPRLGQNHPSKVWLAPARCKPPRPCPCPWKRREKERKKMARPPGGLCMIKVTSKIGSHKRGQSFAIVRPDSVGCPTRKRSVCPLRAAGALYRSWASLASTPGFPTARKQIRYARPRVGWFQVLGPSWFASRGWRRREEEEEEESGAAAEVVVAAVATHPESCVLLCSLPLQRLWALAGVWCVSTDVIPRS